MSQLTQVRQMTQVAHMSQLACLYCRGATGSRFRVIRVIAAGLNERGIPAARGGRWSAVQVSRLMEIAGLPFEPASAAGA
jgi:hypothetical protein